GEPQHAGRRAKRGLQHVGVAHVPPAGFTRRRRTDTESAPFLGVEDGGKHRRAVELRPAQPCECAVAGDECRRAAVTNDRVVVDACHFGSFLSAEPLCMAMWSVTSLLIAYCGSSGVACTRYPLNWISDVTTLMI